MAFELLCRQAGTADMRFAVGTGPIMVGALSSNHVAITAPGMEPIHALIEVGSDGVMRVTDLGTLRGVKINGKPICVEGRLELGDILDIGGTFFEVKVALPGPPQRSAVKQATSPHWPRSARKRRLSGLPQRLFRHETQPLPANHDSPILEVVAYWGNTVLNVDHFQPGNKGSGQVTIGDSASAHFVAGGREMFKVAVLADVSDGRSALYLRQGMRAKVRQDGHTKKVHGKQLIDLGVRDYAHIQYGPVRYFLHYTQHPVVKLPPPPPRNAFHTSLALGMTTLYLVLIAVALLLKPESASVFDQNRYEEPILILPPLEQTLVVEKTEPKKVDLTRVKKTKPPVRVVQDQVKPAVPAVSPKPKVTAPTRSNVNLVKKALSPQAIPTAKSLALNAPSVGRENPNNERSEQGGPKNSLQSGVPVRGPGLPNLGVEGGRSANQSMINLEKLKANGLTKISDTIGGVPTAFKPGGGLGKPGGSSLATGGLGGVRQGKSLNMAGPGGEGFGHQPGGFLGGQNGSASRLDGLKSGKGQANVAVFDPVSGGLPADMSSEILFVIRKHLNEIRHCYNKTLQYNPNLSGKLTAAFSIGADGRVVASKIRDGSITDIKMRACVTGVVDRWSFPRPPAGLAPVNVTYPFVFHRT